MARKTPEQVPTSVHAVAMVLKGDMSIEVL